MVATKIIIIIIIVIYITVNYLPANLVPAGTKNFLSAVFVNV